MYLHAGIAAMDAARQKYEHGMDYLICEQMGRAKLRFGSGGVLLAVLAIAEVTTKVTIGQKWADAIIYTVVLFTIIIMAIRPRWSTALFWRSVLPLFAIHSLILVILVQTVPLGPLGFPKLLLIPAVIIEGLIMLAINLEREPTVHLNGWVAQVSYPPRRPIVRVFEGSLPRLAEGVTKRTASQFVPNNAAAATILSQSTHKGLCSSWEESLQK